MVAIEANPLPLRPILLKTPVFDRALRFGWGTIMLRKLLAALTVVLTLGLAPAAMAAPVTWYATATYDDGAVLGGSFVYDADTNTYSSVNLTMTGGNRPNRTYVTGAVVMTSTVLVALTSAGTGTGNPIIELVWTGALDNAGGSRPLAASLRDGECANSSCGSISSTPEPRRVVSGQVSTTAPIVTPVPTLTEWAMILLGLVLAGAAALHIQRRRLTL